ncbi:MAG: glycosyltransferase [Labilithrix sp.]|nr:glycosyltransferase [Labilithrix sp.]
MTKKRSVAIVVPCFNEAARLPVERFVAFLAEHDDVRFVFCDDGSTDGTGRVLEELVARAGGRAEQMTLPQNRGKAEAVRLGLLRALETGADVVGYLDADLATPLEELPAMGAQFDDDGILAVTGARIQRKGAQIERRPFRHYTGRVFATAAALALGTFYYDTQCGAKLFRRSPILDEALAAPFHSAWIFDVELLGRLMIGAEQGAAGPTTIREHPLTRWRDVGGSKVRASTFAKAPFELWRLSIELRRWRRRRA